MIKHNLYQSVINILIYSDIKIIFKDNKTLLIETSNGTRKTYPIDKFYIKSYSKLGVGDKVKLKLRCPDDGYEIVRINGRFITLRRYNKVFTVSRSMMVVKETL